MACNIDKMLIKGIRSFSPDNQIPIEFYKPLTLIVGQNGAGKTVRALSSALIFLMPWRGRRVPWCLPLRT